MWKCLKKSHCSFVISTACGQKTLRPNFSSTLHSNFPILSNGRSCEGKCFVCYLGVKLLRVLHPLCSAVCYPEAVWETEVTNKQGGELCTIIRIFTYVSVLQWQFCEKQDSSKSSSRLQNIRLLPQNVLTKILQELVWYLEKAFQSITNACNEDQIWSLRIHMKCFPTNRNSCCWSE